MISWDDAVAAGIAEFPKFTVKPYSQSALFRFLTKIGWSAAALTLWNTVYMNDREFGTDEGVPTLLHEMVHVRDQHSWSLLFFISYFILPIGPSLKSIWEWRAYKESLRAYHDKFYHFKQENPEYYKYIMDFYCNWVADWFVSTTYLWMWPFRSVMYKMARDFVNSLDEK